MSTPTPRADLREIDIAKITGLTRAAVNKWLKQDRVPFPSPTTIESGSPRFDPREVLDWLDKRRIRSGDRLPGEPAGTTYGDRARRRRAELRRNPDISPDEFRRHIEYVLNRLRKRVLDTGVPDEEYLHAALLLTFTSVCEPQIAAQITSRSREKAAEAAPRVLLDDIGWRVSAALGRHRIDPGENGKLLRLDRARTRDIAELVDRCDNLGARGFDQLCARHSRFRTRPDNYRTPPAVARLMARCAVGLTAAKTAVDLHIRGGELLLAAAECPNGSQPMSLHGFGLDAGDLRIAGMRLAVHGHPATLQLADTTPWYTTDSGALRADAVMVNPFFNTNSETIELSRSWPFGPPPPQRNNFAWMQYAIEATTDGGVAVVLMPDNAAISNDLREKVIRRAMFETGSVRALIALPAGLFPGTAAPATMWILQRKTGRPAPVLCVDAHPMTTRTNSQPPYRLDGVEQIIETVQEVSHLTVGEILPLPHGGRAALVPYRDLAEAEFSSSTVAYVDAVARRPTTVSSRDVEQIGREMQTASPGGASPNPSTAHADANAPARQGIPLAYLCDLQTGPYNSILKRLDRHRAGSGIPILWPRHLVDRRVAAADAERIHARDAEALSRYAIRTDDVLLVRSGSIGEPAIVTDTLGDAICGTNLIRIRVTDPQILDPWYLHSYLLRPTVLGDIRQQAGQNLVPSINSEMLGKVTIELPSIEEQRKLGALMRKIDIQTAHYRHAAEVSEKLRRNAFELVLSGEASLP